MNRPLLSVTMCNYNYGHFIGEALDSILTQSYSPFEVIVVDDGSTDNSVEVIKGFMGKHPNLYLFENKKNMGIPYTANRALENAKGEYIFSISSDDKILPGFFEKSMSLLSQYPEAGMCFSDNVVYDGSGYIENRSFLADKSSYLSPDEVLKEFLKEAFTPFIPHTGIIKFSALKQAGGYLPELKWSCDSFAYSVIAFRQGLCYMPEILTVIKVHPGQHGASNAKNSKLEREVIRNLIEAAKRPAYRDVYPKFKRTAPFSVYPWEVLMVVSGNRKYWDFLSFKLLRFALFDKIIRRPLLKVLPMSFCRFLINEARGVRFRALNILRLEK